MLEIEVKYAVENWGAIEAKLKSWGAKPNAAREDVDQYFKPPDRDYGQTDEALRIRRIGDDNFVTYKGPKTDAQTKTRTEIEVALAPGESVAKSFGDLLTHLRYQPVLVVRKQRTAWHLRRENFDLEVCLDQVDELGKYVELEIQAPKDALDSARAVLLKTSAELGLHTTERRGYLQLLLAKRGLT